MTQLIIARKAPGRSLSFSRRVPGGFSHPVPWGVGPGCPLGTVLGAFFQLFQPRVGLPGACCHLCHERGGLSTIWMMTGVALTPSMVTPRRGTHRSPAPNCTPCTRPSSPHSPGCARTGGCSGTALGCPGTALGCSGMALGRFGMALGCSGTCHLSSRHPHKPQRMALGARSAQPHRGRVAAAGHTM